MADGEDGESKHVENPFLKSEAEIDTCFLDFSESGKQASTFRSA